MNVALSRENRGVFGSKRGRVSLPCECGDREGSRRAADVVAGVAGPSSRATHTLGSSAAVPACRRLLGRPGSPATRGVCLLALIAALILTAALAALALTATETALILTGGLTLPGHAAV